VPVRVRDRKKGKVEIMFLETEKRNQRSADWAGAEEAGKKKEPGGSCRAIGEISPQQPRNKETEGLVPPPQAKQVRNKPITAHAQRRVSR